MKALILSAWDPQAITALVTAVLGFFAGLLRGKKKPAQPKPGGPVKPG